MNQFEVKITRQEWVQKLKAAQEFMVSRDKTKRVLVSVAAQHPLIEGLYPNEEFQQRLLLGKKLYWESVEKGLDVEIYVPGNRHVYNGVADKISLSRAGKNFLLEQGLPHETIRDDDLNRLYKGGKGVYNGADECFITASYFKDKNFGRLYCAVSPVQLCREALFYIWFGVLPLFYTAPTQNTFHDYIKEVYDIIPYVRDVDPDMQGDDSYFGNLSRKERVPKDGRME